jgi:primary-amine oxidase
VAQRAKFASKPLWVVKDKETEKGTERMWPSGKYVPQSRGEVDDSIGKWVEGGASVENEDVVLFITVGGSKRDMMLASFDSDRFLTCRGDTYSPP